MPVFPITKSRFSKACPYPIYLLPLCNDQFYRRVVTIASVSKVNLLETQEIRHKVVNLKLLLTLEAWRQKFSKCLFQTSHHASNLHSFENSYGLRIQISIARYHRIIPRGGLLPKKNQKFTFVSAFFRAGWKNSEDCS